MTWAWSSLRWYADRLLAMTPREVVHRLTEAAVRQAWRWRPAGWGMAAAVSADPFPSFPAIRAALAAAGRSPSPALADAMGRMQSGRFAFLGHDWPALALDREDFGSDRSDVMTMIDSKMMKHDVVRKRVPALRHHALEAAAGFWLHDPIHGGRWPGAERSAFQVDVRSTAEARDGAAASAARPGDVKYVWEPNRLQMLHPAAAALAAGEPWAMGRATALLRSWVDANPPHRGVNWVSGIELALRIVSLALLVAAAGPEGLPAAERSFLRRLLVAHARQLEAFPSLFSSANNHRVAEGLGLMVAGLLLADGRWEGQGRAILDEEALRQLLPDGVGAEQSPTYQAFTMEMLAFGMLVARDAGRPLSAALADRLAAGAEFLRALMDPTGRVPSIGDDDEGRVLAQPPDREPRYVASVTAAIAALTGRPALIPPTRDRHLRDHLFGVPAGGRELADGVTTFRDGGYTVARERIGGRCVHLVFDHGPLGYLRLAAHGHSDALAVWLDLDGRPVLIDAGTYLYHAGGATRTRLRESLAHNTLAVAGLSQSVPAAGFAWRSRARSMLLAREEGPCWSVTGRHDGYRRRLGVLHRRRVCRRPDGFALGDALEGAGAGVRPVEIRFLVHAALDVIVEDGAVALLAQGEPLCRLTGPPGFSTTVADGEDAPPASESFGHLGRARGIVFAGALGEAELATRISIVPRLADRQADGTGAAASAVAPALLDATS